MDEDDLYENEDDVMQCHVCLKPYTTDENGDPTHLNTRLDRGHKPRS